MPTLHTIFGLLLISMVSFVAQAGRETHGVLPGFFSCSGESKTGSSLELFFPLSGKQTEGRFIVDRQEQAILPCLDNGANVRLSSKWKQTIFCEDPDSVFVFKVFESNRGAKAEIWETGSALRKTHLVWELSCR